MDDKIQRFDTEITNFGEVNNGFIRATVNIFTEDQVANGFEFQNTGIEKRRKEWGYVPVVAEYIEEENDLGSHGGKLTITDNGISYKRTTIPMGVAIANTDRFEEVTCMNGTTKKYFCTDVYLWYEQFQEELSMFKNGESRPQSMEVKIKDSTFEDGVEKVYDFEPLAICILGSSVPPAFVDSKVKVGFEDDGFKVEFNKMLDALDKYVSNQEKGDENFMEENKDIDMEQEVTEVETTEKIDEIVVATEEAPETTEEVEMSEIDEVSNEVEEVVIEDTPSENYEAKNIELEAKIVEMESNISELEAKNLEMSQEIETLKANFEEVNIKYQSYVSAEIKAEKDNLIDAFSSKLTTDEIENCLGDVANFTIEDIETKLTLALGKKEMAKTIVEQKSEFTNLGNLTENNYFSQLAKKIKR